VTASLLVATISLCFGILADSRAETASANEVKRLAGYVVILPGSATNLLFKTDSGLAYNLKRSTAAEALFLDPELLKKHLLLTGKVQGKDFEVTGILHSVREGKVYELFYYCDICSISSSFPGLCQCCREPSVLTEKAVPE
jgi:hypothetical protein